MSTDWHLVCRSHSPEISSQAISGGTGAAEDLLDQRSALVEATRVLSQMGLDVYNLGLAGENIVIAFLRQHPTCDVILRDENGNYILPSTSLGDLTTSAAGTADGASAAGAGEPPAAPFTQADVDELGGVLADALQPVLGARLALGKRDATAALLLTWGYRLTTAGARR